MILHILALCAALPAIVEEAPAGAKKLLRPGTRGRDVQTATTSRGPWVDSNAWQYRRMDHPVLLYDNVPTQWLPLAAAEAYVYSSGKDAVIRTDAAGRAAIQPMMEFLKTLDRSEQPAVADIFVYDDGTARTGEILNLLARRNLLFDAGKSPSRAYPLEVRIGQGPFTEALATNPSDFTYAVRKALTDAKRTLRIYGSESIIGFLTADARRARLHLLNYATDPVESFRLRVRGSWKVAGIRSFRDGSVAAEDEDSFDGGTEFGIPKLSTYAVVDLVRK